MHFSFIFIYFCGSKWWWSGANVCIAPTPGTCINWGYFGKSWNDICHWSVLDNAPMWPRVHPLWLPRLGKILSPEFIEQKVITVLWIIREVSPGSHLITVIGLFRNGILTLLKCQLNLITRICLFSCHRVLMAILADEMTTSDSSLCTEWR